MGRIFRLVFTGFCMGAADIIPGVSGGTMAFILGIYEELVDTIHRWGSSNLWKLLFQGKFRKFFQRCNIVFLVSVLGGIGLAVLSLSHLLESLLETHPLYVWGFFFGLVLASAVAIFRRVGLLTNLAFVALVAGGVLAHFVVQMVPVQTPEEPWFLILSGAIAICAMILPGISGSFLLVILGKYQFVLQAVNTRDIGSLFYIALGALGGILGFSHVVRWLLREYHDVTVAFLIGLMLGSVQKIWPWKVGDTNILPTVSEEFWYVLGVMVLGCISVSLLERIADSND